MLMNPPMHTSEQNITFDEYSNAQCFDVTTLVDQIRYWHSGPHAPSCQTHPRPITFASPNVGFAALFTGDMYSTP